ncbi:MAG: non-canonical purine NTP pyrophosphatase, RdgB/HAM1 family [Euryarchaeota archaeon]|nr:non-canonical purine NTP pyrophosphatase, RdgB/HAM1 family [Euryarchaeota archaeon]OUW22695.1 MAG: non-canonical purine NTP pyrophosphatase, RdgB/HAM1 family [Euryarchaeota archaeon TMED173]
MDSDQMELLFATGNKHKIEEAKEIFSNFDLRVSQLIINGKIPQLIEPQTDSIEEVSKSKIKQVREIIVGTRFEGSTILVEDSGLFIDSLGGFPGPYSSYIKEKIGLSGILQLLRNSSSREAQFMAAAAINYDGKTTFAVGTCKGTISSHIKGTDGFGYDPIFIPNIGDGRTCGELSNEEKSLISHRSMALKEVAKLLISRQSE